MEAKRKKTASLPDAPGVYLLMDGEGKVIYVGKAASLRKRVASYFQSREEENPRLASLRSRIADIDFIVTENESEALILEANLIKRFHPPYNIDFRDDKSYPYMVIRTEDRFPRVMFMRGRRGRRSVYYGPFAHAGAVRETIDTLRKVFPFRACRGREPGKGTGGPCLDYHIGLCCGPCTGEVSPEEYGRIIAGVRGFMEGDHQAVLARLEMRMREEAERREFELAARTRDRIVALRRILERQQAHSLQEGDQDVFALCAGDLDACVTVLYVRGGKILGKQDFFSTVPAGSGEGDILAAFLPQFYAQSTQIAREVLLSHPLEDEEKELLEGWLTSRAGRRVRIHYPRRGDKRRLVEKAARNARLSLEVRLAKQASDLGWVSRAVNGVREGLSLHRLPYRMECYDISNLGGEDAVASMVVFEGGLPLRKDYRRFRIRSADGRNDVAMMEEVIERRLSRLSQGMGEGEGAQIDAEKAPSRLDSFHKKPDLILVDGGEAQLAAAARALARHGLQDIEVAALAKRLEEIHLPGRGEPVSLPRDSEALHLLQRLRDEAHRYALEHHRAQREKRARSSLLDGIPGIGPKRKRGLLRHYGSLARVAQASLEELRELSFLDARSAENLYRALHPPAMEGED
ncbi:MAG: excinuclease ABC subunit UvrC [Actinobacteria bacterium]|nr:excinuclease ABC subunit UvrC [Actinomycetota bacterium]